jgi:Protein of unknown function (DUF3293)
MLFKGSSKFYQIMSQPQFTEQEIASLQMAYQEAIYEVYFGQEIIQLSIGKHNLALDGLLSKHDGSSWALITAHNPYSQSLSARENQQRHQSFREFLLTLNLTIFDAVGKDKDGVWTPELSVLIVSIELIKAIALGRKFQQNAIVYGELGKPIQLIWL